MRSNCSRSGGGSRPLASYTAVIERDAESGLYIGYVPGFRGAHGQGATREELQANLADGIAMLLEDGEPQLESKAAGWRAPPKASML